MRAVEMFKVRMQGQYGSPGDKRLAAVVREMWTQWGLRKGIMRGFWVRSSHSILLARIAAVCVCVDESEDNGRA